MGDPPGHVTLRHSPKTGHPVVTCRNPKAGFGVEGHGLFRTIRHTVKSYTVRRSPRRSTDPPFRSPGSLTWGGGRGVGRRFGCGRRMYPNLPALLLSGGGPHSLTAGPFPFGGWGSDRDHQPRAWGMSYSKVSYPKFIYFLWMLVKKTTRNQIFGVHIASKGQPLRRGGVAHTPAPSRS